MTSSGPFVDLSHELNSSTQVYPGNAKFSSYPATTLEKDYCNVMGFSLNSHTGTHIDAPYHFMKDGACVPQIDLSLFQGPALVIDVRGKQPRETITWKDLSPYKSQMREGIIVLLHTGWSAYWQSPKYLDHPFLDRAAAEGLVNMGIRTIAIDTLSPDETVEEGESKGGFVAHEIILGAGGIIGENLTNLDAITFDDPVVSLLPLKLTNGDGSPVRAVAWSAGQKK